MLMQPNAVFWPIADLRRQVAEKILLTIYSLQTGKDAGQGGEAWMTSERIPANKAPATIAKALSSSWRTARVHAVLSAWGYLPDAWIRAFSMESGAHIILMNEPFPIIDRCGQLIAIRNFADKA